MITEILKDYELTGSSLLIEDLEIAPKEKITNTGIILTEAPKEGIETHKAKVLKAGRGHYSDQGIFIENPIKTGAIIYYKNAGEYILEGIKFKGTEGGQVIAYKNLTDK